MVTWEAEVEATSYQAAAENARAMLWRNGDAAEMKFLVAAFTPEGGRFEPPMYEVDVTTGLTREVVPEHELV